MRIYSVTQYIISLNYTLTAHSKNRNGKSGSKCPARWKQKGFTLPMPFTSEGNILNLLHIRSTSEKNNGFPTYMFLCD